MEEVFFEVVPHVYATIWSTLIIIGLSLFIFFYFKKNGKNKKPSGFQSAVEGTFDSFHRTMETTAGDRMKKAYPYFFTLLIFIFVNSIMEILGFVNPAGSIAFTLTIGLITFVGIYVIGIFTQGLWTFIKQKYVNPIEIIGQFSPLISISLRLFGAVFAGSLLGQVFIIILGTFFTTVPALEAIPFINIFYQWIMLILTIAFGGLQAYVFVMLTMIYWSEQLGDKKERNSIRKQSKMEKKAKRQEIKDVSNVLVVSDVKNTKKE